METKEIINELEEASEKVQEAIEILEHLHLENKVLNNNIIILF